MGKGQELYKKAKQIIPGGTMLLSKRPELHLPEFWPSYYSRAKGCHIWDLDDNEYLDFYLMGIGTNVLGYGNDVIDQAVFTAVRAGNMSTLNCAEEVKVAERLVELHPWSDMVRFARSGGEANSIGIRIARAASGKDKIAICGYHGWHDWYLSANLSGNQKLSGHLLPGLDPAGVPGNLSETVVPFSYNDIEEFRRVISENPELAAVKMEVSRNTGPNKGYLEEIRRITSERGIILIFDECTSGFRQSFGGLHKFYNVEPDMAIFGKTLGNGYPITAVIGKRDIMEAAQSTFISTTFWTERSGSAAALATLDEMERLRSWEVITEKGRQISESWKELGLAHGLNVVVSGLPALTSFNIPSENWLKYKTYITQEMLKIGILAASTVYVSIAHQKADFSKYWDQLDILFKTISECEKGEKLIDGLLDGPVCQSGFKRLN